MSGEIFYGVQPELTKEELLSQYQLAIETIHKLKKIESKLDCAVKALEDIENFIEYIKKCDHSTTESERARLALEEIKLK